jgi:hypothetical protein
MSIYFDDAIAKGVDLGKTSMRDQLSIFMEKAPDISFSCVYWARIVAEYAFSSHVNFCNVCIESE